MSRRVSDPELFARESAKARAERYACELSLLPRVREAEKATLIVADGFSSRHQICDAKARRDPCRGGAGSCARGPRPEENDR